MDLREDYAGGRREKFLPVGPVRRGVHDPQIEVMYCHPFDLRGEGFDLVAEQQMVGPGGLRHAHQVSDEVDDLKRGGRRRDLDEIVLAREWLEVRLGVQLFDAEVAFE